MSLKKRMRHYALCTPPLTSVKMQYKSTRHDSEKIPFTEAVARGLAPDGGLYLPDSLPDLSGYLPEWESLDYEELCIEFFKHFATDIPTEKLAELVHKAYAGFDHEDRAPLVQLAQDIWVCELFHGPTLAFKDFALQLLGQLYGYQIERTGKPINVLGATSGDTGAAAIYGLMDLPGINLFILYPNNRVSPLQERQMTCTGRANVYPLAIEGSFDDAQRWIKQLFSDLEFKAQYNLSAINSINLARVLAQCVYYIYAYFRIPEGHRENIQFVVPTGNFGNILAGWMTSKMGLPVKHFKIATNQNDILWRLFNTGEYKLDRVSPSLAPSMDIQVASNFERFLYYLVGEDSAKVREIMKTFLQSGEYSFESFDRDAFSASRSDDEIILNNIKHIKSQYGYTVDPHTATAFTEDDPTKTRVIMATAHPAKFLQAMEASIGEATTHPVLEALKSRDPVKYELTSDAELIRHFIVDHSGIAS